MVRRTSAVTSPCVWVGRDDYKPMGLTGSSGALYIWSRLIRDLKAKPLDLIPPPDVEEQLADTVTGLKADEGCDSRLLIPYLRGYAPQSWAPCARRGCIPSTPP